MLAAALATTVTLGTGVSMFIAQAQNSQGNNSDQGTSQQNLPVGSSLEVRIENSGKVSVRGARITSLAGNVLQASVKWGSVNLNWTVVADQNTEIVRRFDEKSSFSEFSVGDLVSFNGMLDTSVASPFTVKARQIKDWSLMRDNNGFVGIVQSVNVGAQTFVLRTDQGRDITIHVNSLTKIVKDNNETTSFAMIAVNAKVTVKGMMNTATNTLEASQVKIHSASTLPTKTTLEGKIKSTSPFIITVKDKDYIVNVDSETSVLNTLWLRVPFANFRANDTIRVYGAVNSENTIQATVIRDVSIR